MPLHFGAIFSLPFLPLFFSSSFWRHQLLLKLFESVVVAGIVDESYPGRSVSAKWVEFGREIAGGGRRRREKEDCREDERCGDWCQCEWFLDDSWTDDDLQGEPFREAWLMPKRKLRGQLQIEQATGRAVVEQKSRMDIHERLAVRRPRAEEMSTDQVVIYVIYAENRLICDRTGRMCGRRRAPSTPLLCLSRFEWVIEKIRTNGRLSRNM